MQRYALTTALMAALTGCTGGGQGQDSQLTSEGTYGGPVSFECRVKGAPAQAAALLKGTLAATLKSAEVTLYGERAQAEFEEDAVTIPGFSRGNNAGNRLVFNEGNMHHTNFYQLKIDKSILDEGQTKAAGTFASTHDEMGLNWAEELTCKRIAADTGSATVTAADLEKIGDEAQYGNGGAYSGKYDMTTFTVAAAIKDLQEGLGENSDCVYEPLIGRRDNIEAIRRNIDDHLTADRLEALRVKDQLKTIVSLQWDSASGDSEYCSKYPTMVYTNNGLTLFIDYDITD